MTSLMGPADAPFRQQRLPAWQPILSPPYVISCFLLITAIFIPIGGVIVSASSSVVEQVVRYDDVAIADAPRCLALGKPNCSCADYFNHVSKHRELNLPMVCSHTVTFRVSSEIPAPVYMYYRLENYHQNHRRFAKSRYDPQLAGKSVSSSELNGDCDPFEKLNGSIINPCGLIAWALFNDSFFIYETTKANTVNIICNTSVPSRRQCSADNPQFAYYQRSCGGMTANRCEKDGIAWASDVQTKFHQDADYINNPDYVSFPKEYLNESGHLIPDVNDEDLMVWMRTAAMPTFRKLLRKIEVPLKVGVDYQIDITERYPVASFDGTKALVFANNAWIGGRSELLGSAYLAIGSICAILAAGFLLKHVLSPRDPGDLAFFQNQRD